MRNEFTMMVGLPGAGKSTYAEKYAREHDALLISSDDMRELILGDVNNHDKEDQNYLFNVINNMIRDALECKENVVYDATNMLRKHREALLKYIGDGYYKRCIIIAKTIEECFAQNLTRERQVPQDVIIRMYKSFQTPWYSEGFDEIKIENTGELFAKPEEILISMLSFPQDNKHHTKPLGHHMADVAMRIHEKYPEDVELCYAAMLHDIGKPYTKTFMDYKGNVTEDAHYYSHHNVGAYDALMVEFPDDVDKLDVSNLICLHMDPYFWNGEGAAEKYKVIWGDKLYNRVIALHAADQIEH